MEIDEFIKQLDDKFYEKGTWLKSNRALKESVLATIKSHLLKKNLILVSRSELDQLHDRIRDKAQ